MAKHYPIASPERVAHLLETAGAVAHYGSLIDAITAHIHKVKETDPSNAHDLSLIVIGLRNFIEGPDWVKDDLKREREWEGAVEEG